METIVKILDVEMGTTTNGPIASIVLKSASDTMNVRMFARDIEAGKHKKYFENVGKQVVSDIRPNLYKGNLQYQLGFDDKCQTLTEYWATVPKPALAPQPAKAS